VLTKQYRIESLALHSKTWTGVVSHGTYSQIEFDKKVVERRVAELTGQGYKSVNVIEITTGGGVG